ncbi:MAG: serine/threonine-protein phosphatase, partial [Myxococcales bacterium]
PMGKGPHVHSACPRSRVARIVSCRYGRTAVDRRIVTASPVSGPRWSPSQPETRATVLEYAAATHVGQVRSVNEDTFLVGPPVFVVADGMGGYARGDVASTLVVEAFEALVGRSDLAVADLTGCIDTARAAISALDEGDGPPGSTVVAAAYVVESGHGYWLIAHEGDSRAYVWRKGSLQQITRDHSVVQELIDAGELNAEQARSHHERHVITRAVGALPDSLPEFSLVPVEPDTRLLLCSDGLTGELSETSIALLLEAASGAQEAVDSLVRAGVDAGGHDNVTALVVEVVRMADDATVDTLGSPDDFRSDTLPSARRRA